MSLQKCSSSRHDSYGKPFSPILILVCSVSLNIPIAFFFDCNLTYLLSFINDSIPVSLVMQRYWSPSSWVFSSVVGHLFFYHGGFGDENPGVFVQSYLVSLLILWLAIKPVVWLSECGWVLWWAVSLDRQTRDARCSRRFSLPRWSLLSVVMTCHSLAAVTGPAASSWRVSPVTSPGNNLIIFALLANVSRPSMS